MLHQAGFPPFVHDHTRPLRRPWATRQRPPPREQCTRRSHDRHRSRPRRALSGIGKRVPPTETERLPRARPVNWRHLPETRQTGRDDRGRPRRKEVLAFEATRLLHGDEEAEKAKEAAKALFSGSPAGDTESMPCCEIEIERLREGIPAFILFADSEIVKSRGEARRLIQQGGGYVNGRRLEQFDEMITEADLEDGSLLLRAGKKNYKRTIKNAS